MQFEKKNQSSGAPKASLGTQTAWLSGKRAQQAFVSVKIVMAGARSDWFTLYLCGKVHPFGFLPLCFQPQNMASGGASWHRGTLAEAWPGPFKPQSCGRITSFSLFLLTWCIVSDKIGTTVANILADLTLSHEPKEL